MPKDRCSLALIALGLAALTACGSGETLLGESDWGGDAATEVDGDGTDAPDAVTDGAPLEVPDARDVPEWDAGDVPDVVPTCGNGALDPGEECDDGNRLDGDGCDWTCRLGDGEPPGPPDESAPTVRSEGDPAPLEGDWGRPYPADCSRVPFFWTDDSYSIVWSAAAGGRFTRFDRAGHRVGVEWTLPHSDEFDAAWSGTGFGLVWCGLDTIWMQILGRDGKPEGAPVLLASHPTEECLSIAVAWDGDGYGVFSAWDPTGLRFLRTDPLAAVVVEDALVRVAGEYHSQCVSAAAGGGTALAAVSADHPDLANRTEVTVVDTGGTPVRVGSVIASYSGGPPQARWDGDQYGVLTFGTDGDGESVYLARMSPSGDLLGPPSRLIEDTGVRDLALAAGPGWAAASHHVGVSSLTLTRADRSGRVVQRLLLDSTVWESFRPQAIGLAFDGEGFGLVGMTDARSGIPWFGRFALEP